MTTLTVRPGQIWADNDARHAGRQVRVDTTDDTHATCTVVANDNETQEYVDGKRPRPEWMSTAYGDRRGATTRIKLSRFRPTSTGYRLVKDAEDPR